MITPRASASSSSGDWLASQEGSPVVGLEDGPPFSGLSAHFVLGELGLPGGDDLRVCLQDQDEVWLGKEPAKSSHE